MQLKETFTVAVDALRANKLRAVLTSIGVVIGSASIVLVVTVALTSQRFVISQIEAMGSNLVWVELVKRPGKTQPLSHELSLGDLEAVRATIPNLTATSGFNDIPMTVIVNGQERPVRLIGVTDGYQAIRRLIVFHGRYFDPSDVESRSKVCLITQALATRMFGQENAVGRPIRMGDIDFTVIGVFRERSSTYGLSEIQKETVIIPFPLMKYYTGENSLGTIQAQAASPDEVPTVERRVYRLVKSRHPQEAEYDPQTLVGILSAAKNISLGLTIMLVVIAFIALLISGVGIMNIMLVTVTERTREIGVRKAIGASRAEIMGQFLIEAFLISGGGAVIGILIGLAIPVIVQQLLPANLRVPISGKSVIVAFLVSCSTGLFFGWLPANQAARLDPVESLRYE
ncbi:MAG: ABC transporter permease [Candidatus Acidiferrum sp.]